MLKPYDSRFIGYVCLGPRRGHALLALLWPRDAATPETWLVGQRHDGAAEAPLRRIEAAADADAWRDAPEGPARDAALLAAVRGLAAPDETGDLDRMAAAVAADWSADAPPAP